MSNAPVDYTDESLDWSTNQNNFNFNSNANDPNTPNSGSKTIDTGETLIKATVTADPDAAGTITSRYVMWEDTTGEPNPGSGPMPTAFGSNASGTNLMTFAIEDDPKNPGTVNTLRDLEFRLYGLETTPDLSNPNPDPDPLPRAVTQLVIRATDADGNPVPITFTHAGAGDPTYTISYDADTHSYTLTGTGTRDALNSAVDLRFDGPVAHIEMEHSNTSTHPNPQGAMLWMSNWAFTPTSAICFARGTLIRTPAGDVAVEDLAVGDLVLTRDNGARPIRWIAGRRWRLAPGCRNHPVRIAAGALGAGTPAADLLVSPQHRVLVRSAIARRMFGTDEILVAACQLDTLDGIAVCDDLAEIEYFHFLLDRHEVVISNGAETEALFTGPEALKSVGRAAREEIFALFPELRDNDHLPQAARPLVSGRSGRELAARHARNGKRLVC